MTTTDKLPNQVHQGRNVKRFREMLGMKQEGLASELGEEWSQKRVSLLENRQTLESDLLAQVAKALRVPEEAIKNFDEEAAVTYFNTFTDNNFSSGSAGVMNANNCSFNPLDKLIELVEENKKLYERLLKAEQSKNELLERLLKGRE
ncbi:transcriptional regulator [Pontibacter sp. SGAir0037]|nr:helix-turn-helix transcriptional regulator [Pontibacter sp. SGAir0037]QCR21645.1 transcriptional regulator [Pontibacter sp. SGAir0037]